MAENQSGPSAADRFGTVVQQGSNSTLLGGSRGAMGGGLMAVLGSLAYLALQSQSTENASASPIWRRPAPMAPNGQADMQRKAMPLVRAMIQAAKADGQVDQQEMQRIMGKLDAHGHDDAAR